MRVFCNPLPASLAILFSALWVAPSRADQAVTPPAQPVVAEPSAAAAAPEPAESDRAAALVVETLHDALIGVMKEADSLGYEGRREKLGPVLAQTFDVAFMAQKSVGRHWKKMGEEDRARLLETFASLTVANYAGRFDGYSDQRFETLKVEPSTHGTMVVHSRLVEADGDTTQLNYRLRPAGGGWRIIDVYLNGTVSELALRRSEYSSMIQREGLPALIAALDERIADLATGKADAQSEAGSAPAPLLPQICAARFCR